MNSIRATFSPREDYINRWATYWSSNGYEVDVFSILKKRIEHNERLQDYELVFNLAYALNGPSDAFNYLVIGHHRNHGWNHYYTEVNKSIKRWEIVRRTFSKQWFEFLARTVTLDKVSLDKLMLVRIVDYCFFMKKPELALAVTQQAVDTTLQLVSPIPMPHPNWLDHIADHE